MDNHDHSEPQREKQQLLAPLLPYENSVPLPSHLFDGYFSALEPRIHPFADYEVKEITRFRHDWEERGGGRTRSGSLSRSGGLLSLIVPEGITDRLVRASYLSDMGFVYDEFADGEMSLLESRGLRDAKSNEKKAVAVLHQLKAKAFVDMIAGDEESVYYVQGTEEWVRRAVDSRNLDGVEFEDLDEYLNEKVDCFGGEAAVMLMLYVCNIKLTNEQSESLRPIAQMVYRSLVLVNDIFSVYNEWEVHAELARPGFPPNSIFVAMKQHVLTFEQGREFMIKMYQDMEQEMGRLIRSYCDEKNPTRQEINYLYHLQLMVSGTVMWSLHHPRYTDDLAPEYRPRPPDTLETLPRKIPANGDIASTGANNPTVNGEDVSGNTQNPVADEDCASVNGPMAVLNENKLHSITNAEPWSDVPVWLSKSKLFSKELILQPYDYIHSLPSKGFRTAAIEALDAWYEVPETSLETIKSVIDMLHSSSLILDDIEDSSPLRRGHPSAHSIFGISQSINTSNYLFVECLDKIRTLSPLAMEIFTDELRRLHVGQAYDLHWTFHTQCPSESEYIAMIDGKTGGLFRLASRLMRVEGTKNRELEVEDLLTMIGRFFQIRDDYQNLNSADYSSAKGVCSDLDEGKYSLILIHAINQANDSRLLSILQVRAREGSLTAELKRLLMNMLLKSKSMEYTLGVLHELQTEIEKMLEKIEAQVGQEKNWIIRAIMARLQVADPKLQRLRIIA